MEIAAFRKWMRRGIGLGGLGVAVALATGWTGAARGDAPEEALEMPAYRILAQADAWREAGRLRAAWSRYQAALEAFEAIRRDYPDHRPATMAFRADYCRTQVTQLTAALEMDGAPEADPAALLREARAEAAHWRGEAARLAARTEALETRLTAMQRREAARYRPVPPLEAPRPVDGEAEPDRAVTSPEAVDFAAGLADAETRLAAGDAAGAAERFRDLLERAPEDHELRLGLARALHAAGETREASRLANALRRAVPEEAGPPHLQGVMARDAGRNRTALRHFRNAVERAPEAAGLRFDLAEACRAAGRAEEAIEHYLATAMLDPEHGRALFRLAELLSEDPATREDARAFYLRALEQHEPPDAALAERLAAVE